MFGFVDIFVLYFLIGASKSILFIDVGKFPKNPAKIMRATFACRITYVCIAHVF